ncbi:MAG: T9SS type A sorting domain-containing protein, partial [Chitinophagales bacterium]
YDKTGTPVIPAFQYGSPLSSDTTRVNEPLYICCTNYKTPIERLADLENEFTFTEEFKNILLAFPNPNNGKELILNYTLHSKGEVIINVLNTLGKIVYYKKEFALEDLNQSILNLSFLPQGMYVINISNNYKQANTQILIIK